MLTRGALTKATQRLSKPEPGYRRGKAPGSRCRDKAGRIQCGIHCRFCAGIGERRPPEGCPLGPVGCGLPFVPEVFR